MINGSINKWRTILITIVLGIFALTIGPALWPKTHEIVPTASQLPFFMFLSIVESLLFGFGIAFIINNFGKIKYVKREARTRTVWAYVAISWLLISWWPHDNLHQHIGMDLEKLLYIEYGFHLTIIIASLILVYYFVMTLRELRVK